MFLQTFINIMALIYGIIIGSFLNVCIHRIPRKESVVWKSSHCIECGYVLKWYDLIPILSYLILGGKCRTCKSKISIQYPIVEALNGGLYYVIFKAYGISMEAVFGCIFISVLIVFGGIILHGISKKR